MSENLQALAEWHRKTAAIERDGSIAAFHEQAAEAIECIVLEKQQTATSDNEGPVTIPPGQSASDEAGSREFKVRICDQCYRLEGQMCHNPECVFCRRTIGEVGDALEMLLIRPVVDGEALDMYPFSQESATPERSDAEQPNYRRIVWSIVTMLGWGNMPPQRVIEQEIAALKARANGYQAPLKAEQPTCSTCRFSSFEEAVCVDGQSVVCGNEASPCGYTGIEIEPSVAKIWGCSLHEPKPWDAGEKAGERS